MFEMTDHKHDLCGRLVWFVCCRPDAGARLSLPERRRAGRTYAHLSDTVSGALSGVRMVGMVGLPAGRLSTGTQ